MTQMGNLGSTEEFLFSNTPRLLKDFTLTFSTGEAREYEARQIRFEHVKIGILYGNSRILCWNARNSLRKERPMKEVSIVTLLSICACLLLSCSPPDRSVNIANGHYRHHPICVLLVVCPGRIYNIRNMI